MATSPTRLPVKPGEQAPEFTVTCANRDGRISLSDFRDRSPLLLALFRGLY